MSNLFTSEYYLDGINAGLSNYENYQWLPDSTISMARQLAGYLEMIPGDKILDFGCARGFYVKALRILGFNAFGYDISEWAIDNCDPEVKPFVSNHLSGAKFDFVFSKDVFEHIPPAEIEKVFPILLSCIRRKLFIIVPLAGSQGGPYIHPKEENDKTHINRCTLLDWIRIFASLAPGWIVNASFCYPGLKPGTYEHPEAYGFFTLHR